MSAPATPSAKFDGEGNVTIQFHATAPHDLGLPHSRRFVEQVILRDCFDWDDWHELAALWVHWRHARKAVYQFTRYYPDTGLTAEANPYWGLPAELLVDRM